MLYVVSDPSWSDDLPVYLKPDGSVSVRIERAQKFPTLALATEAAGQANAWMQMQGLPFCWRALAIDAKGPLEGSRCSLADAAVA